MGSLNNKNRRKRFCCKSEAQKRAIRRSYALKKSKTVKNGFARVDPKNPPIDFVKKAKEYRQRNLGALRFNGKLYDTNFPNEMVEITKDDIRNLRPEYDFHNRGLSDMDIADRYVSHMRSKYGVFDENDRFLHMLGEGE